MWICLNNAFLSVVTPDKNPDNHVLLVRARRKGDIETVFPGAKVERTPGRDYLFRARVTREDVAAALAAQIEAITYSNFKDSVKNAKLKGAYSRIWSIMSDLQPTRPFSGGRRAGGRDLFHGGA